MPTPAPQTPPARPRVSPYHLTAKSRAILAQHAHQIRLQLTVRRALRDVIAATRARVDAEARQAAGFPAIDSWKQANVSQQLQRMRAGTLAQWPAGCTHLPGVES